MCCRRSRSASSSKGFAVPFLDTLLGSGPSRAVAKKAAALPAALTNGGEAVAAPKGSPSYKAAPEAAALDAGQQALDLQPSYQPREPSSSSASALEVSAASSANVEGVELHSILPLAVPAQVAGQPQAALAAAETHSAAKLVPSSQGDDPKLS